MIKLLSWLLAISSLVCVAADFAQSDTRFISHWEWLYPVWVFSGLIAGAIITGAVFCGLWVLTIGLLIKLRDQQSRR